MPLASGDRVDRYEILALLGKGGMGEVYRARDPKLGREVALKILRATETQGPTDSERLLREARAAAALTHPNVLAVYDLGEVQEPEALRGLPYIAMELVLGDTLRVRMGDTPLSMDLRIAWMLDVARALAAAHASAIVHRDVKPENIMVRADGVVKVLDFGIARRTPAPVDREGATGTLDRTPPLAETRSLGVDSRLTAEGVVLGTPFYMAPEQLRGDFLDGRADQFAWAVVTYELLTGRTPWKRSTDTLSVAAEILSHDPIPPAEIDNRIPADVSEIVMRALEKRPSARFASMTSLVRALEATGSADLPSRIQGAIRRALRRARSTGDKLPIVRWALAGALAFAVVDAVIWARRSRSSSTAGQDAAPQESAPAASCTSNSECVRAHGGEAWRCHTTRHTCLEVASEDCRAYIEAPDLEREDTVWFGGLYPLRERSFDSEWRAADLARQDFARALGGSATRTGDLHARPIGLVLCDEGVDAVRAARHLADDVETPAVLGFRAPRTALTTIPTIFLPRHVLSLITISWAAELPKIPQPAGEARLVWRSTLSDADTVTPLQAFVEDVLDRRKPSESGREAEPVRVAVVQEPGLPADTHTYTRALLEGLHFNQRSALENAENFRQFVFDPRRDPPEPFVAAVVDFAPHFIFVFARVGSAVMESIESGWAHRPRPYYLTPSYFEPDAPKFVGSSLSRRRRFFGVTNASTRLPNAELVLRYNLAYPREPVTRATAPQPSYDAFYTLAYALYALPDGPVTGDALSAAIGRLLPPGPPINVGPGRILDAFSLLRSGASIDLSGAIGSLDFDPSTGEAPIDYSILCFGVNAHGFATEAIDSGLLYDSRAKKLTGRLRCP